MLEIDLTKTDELLDETTNCLEEGENSKALDNVEKLWLEIYNSNIHLYKNHREKINQALKGVH